MEEASVVKGKGSAAADDEADAVLPDDTDTVDDFDAEDVDAEEEESDEASEEESGGKRSAKRDRKSDRPKTKSTGRRRNPVSFVLRFVREVVAELRKVIWPSRKDLITYTAVVIIFLVVMVGLVALLDLGFARLALIVFGGGSTTTS